MLGLSEAETKRLFELRAEYNKRKSAILDIMESQKPTEPITEFSCSMPIRWLEASQVKMVTIDVTSRLTGHVWRG